MGHGNGVKDASQAVHEIVKARNIENYNLIWFLFKYGINLLMKE